MNLEPLKLYLINPRGFCAGVTRAISIVELALKKYGSPLYVRHEVVHNKHVVDDLKAKGVIFVEELNEIPDGSVVIFSAHGVSEAIEREAKDRGLKYIDATCPLVKKVHTEGKKFSNEGKHIVLIGHRGHPEVIGIAGRIESGEVSLVTSVEEAKRLEVVNPNELAYITQTTLSIDDVKDIVDVLVSRFPNITGGQNICYATTHRQEAIKSILSKIDGLIIMGSSNSSNSNRLREIGDKAGIESILIPSADLLDIKYLENKQAIALSAGASAPEVTVQDTIKRISQHRRIILDNITIFEENVVFPTPKELRE